MARFTNPLMLQNFAAAYGSPASPRVTRPTSGSRAPSTDLSNGQKEKN
jgi:hypothetical protein